MEHTVSNTIIRIIYKILLYVYNCRKETIISHCMQQYATRDTLSECVPVYCTSNTGYMYAHVYVK